MKEKAVVFPVFPGYDEDLKLASPHDIAKYMFLNWLKYHHSLL